MEAIVAAAVVGVVGASVAVLIGFFRTTPNKEFSLTTPRNTIDLRFSIHPAHTTQFLGAKQRQKRKKKLRRRLKSGLQWYVVDLSIVVFAINGAFYGPLFVILQYPMQRVSFC
jgi:hypothetical protein